MRISPLLAAILLSLALPAFAETAAEADAATAEISEQADAAESADLSGAAPLEQIQVTATRAAKSTFDVAAAVTVVGQEEIRSKPALTVADYLRAQPGAFIQATTPGQAIPIVRGLKGSEVLHMVDGFRMNTAFFRNSPNQYFALADSQNVQQIELVRGAQSSLYGSDAMGGVVQIVTPEERFEGSSWDGRGRFRAQYTSGDLSSLGRIAGAAGKDGISIAGGVTVQDVGQRKLGGDGGRLPYTDFSSWAADAKLLWSPIEGHELMLSAAYLKQPKTPRVDELVAGFGQTRPNSVEFYFQPQDRLFVQARYTIEQQAGWFDRAEFHVGYQEINDDRRTREFGTANRELEENASRLRGVTATFNKQLGNHGLVYGAEFYYDTIDSFRERLNINSNAISARPPRFPDGSTMNSFAVFLNDSIALAPRWQLDLGGRYSSFDIELPTNSQGIGVKLSPDDFTGNAGLTFKATDTVHVVSNIGRGFRAPNIFDLGVFGDRPSNRFAMPNTDLKPETVITYDLGLKWDNPRWQAEAFVWKSNYKDKITSVETGELTDTGRIIVTNRNVTELDLWGVEAGARWLFSDTSQFYGVLNFTRGDETYAGDNYDADRVPPLNGRLGLLHWFTPEFSLDVNAVYATRQDRLSPRDLTDPRVNPDGTAGWNTWNTRFNWHFAQAASLALHLDNIADRRYREHGSGADEMGRSASVILDWGF
ncbi:iron complex outermembrane receptor protein/hemoglobin/transferrin/lactoferrin receptor protein [Tahibacter aquaticus]|uniref:Iron complex outermembrane receptor protein/hemoglobin/transferrin/lactoferrin receptor protein n=1 Tax=Tahibacter aquaticus TaxID=520092 RepID=A0A4R6YWH7_9GAMM|nr:TonB-dependent receptor [Tahibacter aquaticus]TDR43184.1 iron complex outermembrane receptor protein/hemoglobin/transferrin/lactoferrin receptor protein [Tahibacter aquaticus]